VNQGLPEAAQVVEGLVHVQADDVVAERLDRGRLDVVAAADGEGESVPFEPVAGVGAQDQVRRGVVRVGVHRVGAVQVQ
jgi:hypothetical protein